MKGNDMKDQETKASKISMATVGLVAGALTVILVFLAMKGC